MEARRVRQAPESFFRSKSSIPLGSARLSCLSLNNLPPSPALCHGSRFTSCSMDDVAPLLSPESFFRSRNHCPALFRSAVLSCLGNSSARRFSVERASLSAMLPDLLARPTRDAYRGREVQRKAGIVRIWPYAYTRMRTRPPAPTRKRTTHKKFTIAYI